MQSRLKKKSEIDYELEEISEKIEEHKNSLEHLKNKQEELEELKEKPLGPVCPICGKICKNLKGLKIHIKLKSKYEFQGPHNDAVLHNDIDYTKNGKLMMDCNKCGSSIVLNGQREDRRILDDGGVLCISCRKEAE